jgi:hypothetical protein
MSLSGMLPTVLQDPPPEGERPSGNGSPWFRLFVVAAFVFLSLVLRSEYGVNGEFHVEHPVKGDQNTQADQDFLGCALFEC